MPAQKKGCNACGEKHPRPVNSRCKKQMEVPAAPATPSAPDVNTQILEQLQHLSDRMATMEDRMDAEASSRASSRPSTMNSSISSTPTPARPGDLVIPSLSTLKTLTEVQAKVDDRLRDLENLQMQGKFKSQRGGTLYGVASKYHGPRTLY